MSRSGGADPPASSPRGAALLVAVPLTVLVVLSGVILWPLHYSLFPDDAFYYLCVGRHLAAGDGPTFDGLHATTGFHPLWQAVVALVARLGFDDNALILAVATVNLAAVVAAVILTAVAFRRRGLTPWIFSLTLLLAFADPFVLKTSINGMESGLVWLSWSLAIIALTRVLEGNRGTGTAATAGAAAGFVVLSRLDGLGLALALAWAVLVASRERWLSASAAFLGAFVVCVGPYVAWMVLRFGHWLPVSVLAKSRSGHAHPVLAGLVGLMFVISVVVGVTRLRDMASRRGVAPNRAAAIGAASLALLAGLLPLVLYASGPRIRLSHLWYYPAPLAAGLLLTALAASALWAGGRRRMVMAAAVAAVLTAAAGWTIRASGERAEMHYRVAEAVGQRLARELPAEARIAGWNVGLVAYRRSCRVTNLDGLVNSYEYLDVLRTGRVTSWLDREGIVGLVDYFDADPALWLAERDRALPARVSERFREEFDYVGLLSPWAPPRRRAFVYFDYRLPVRAPYN